MLAYLSPPEALLSQIDPAVTALNLQRRGKFSLRALRALAATVRDRDVGTLVAMNLYAAFYAVLTRSLSKQPLRIVVSVNTTDFATRKEEFQMHLYRHILRRADLVVFGAERQRQLWCSRYGLDECPDRTMVLYNGVDTAEFARPTVAALTRAESAGSVVLGTVGALRAGKAQIDLVRAVHELLGRGVDAQALIVGDGPQRGEIEREMQRLGVLRKVRLVGETRDVRPYLAMMDIFVLPSVSVETFSNAALEAMAMSCPVLAARVGGMDEMLRFGGGMTYPPGDVQSLCDLAMPLVTSSHARRELGELARQAAVRHFSFERMLSQFRARVLGGEGEVEGG